jgi:hypothetical protein
VTSIDKTLQTLIDEEGMEILFSPLRIQGVLQDDHPQESKMVFATMEVLYSGILEDILNAKNPLQEHIQHELAQMLNQRSGIQMSLALWAVQTWIESIPHEYFMTFTEKDRNKKNKRLNDEYENIWQGSIEEVLGDRMKDEK